MEVPAWTAAPLVFAAVGGAALWSWLRPRRRARKNWRRALELVGPGARPTSGQANQPLTIAGRLRVVGPVARFDDGGEAAVVGVEGYGRAAVTDRAAALAVETEHGQIDLEGGVDLLAGSREHHPGDSPAAVAPEIAARIGDDIEPDGDGPVRFRSLAAGDRVRARGILEIVDPDGDAESDSVAAECRYILVNAAIASETRPVVSGPRRARAVVPIAVALVTAAVIFAALQAL